MAKITKKDLARGMDARSAENAIPDGYAEDLQNVDTNSNGHLSKRPGYQGYYGYMPMRVESVTHEGTEIKFQLNGAINTFNITSTPIVVYGHLSGAQSGDFSTTDVVKYYTAFTSDIPDTLATGGSPYTLTEARHQVNTSDAFITALKSTSVTDNSNELIYMDQIDIEGSDPYDIDFTYTLPSDITAYLLVADKSGAGDGGSWAQTDSIPAATSDTISAPASSHLLSNYNILVQTYYDSGTEWVQFIPDDVRINTSSGDVSIDITNSDPVSALSVRTILTCSAIDNKKVGGVGVASTDVIDTTGITEDFNFVCTYINNGSGTLTLVIPDSVTKTDSTDTLAVTLTNSGTSPLLVEYYYQEAELTSSTVIVEDTNSISTNYTDASPQITIWGLPHAGSYNNTDNETAHVTHIDSYKRTGEQRVISGLGGNIFSAQTRAEAGVTYSIPSEEISLEARNNTMVYIGPAFVQSDDYGDALRTRGVIAADDIEDNKATVTAAALVTSGQVKYTLQLTNKVGSFVGALSYSSPTQDYIVITGMSHALHNGTFKIIGFDDGDDSITVENANAILSDFDEAGSAGLAGIFSDQITLQAAPTFVPNDSLDSDVFTDMSVTIKSTNNSDNIVVVDGITTETLIPVGLRIFGSRTGAVLPVADTSDFVKGDMCTINGLSREVRIRHINPAANQAITSISVSDGVATLTSSGVHNKVSGQSVVLLRTGVPLLDGEHEITVLTNTTFSFTTTATSNASTGYILGKTIELDEELTLTDSPTSTTTLAVVGRWIPIEAPTSVDDLPATTRVYHFDTNTYTTQPTIRSTMVADNLYLTNNDDEVMKFDGTNIYQAGLFRWQPQLFAQLDTVSGASLEKSQISMAYTKGTDNSVAVASTVPFKVGDQVWDNLLGSGSKFTIQSIDAIHDKLYFVESISTFGATGTIIKVIYYNYYFRLNAVDANSNIIASAATGVGDFTIELTDSSQVKIRLAGLPAWGTYDYDALELQIYRTKASLSAPYYLVKTVDISFDNYSGYIDIVDGTTDEFLSDFDIVNVGLKGAELGTTWTQPPRAKHLTSLGNRLILGNVKGYQELDIVMRKLPGSGGVTAASLADKTFLLRKDNTDTGTTTNMVDRATYEFKTSGSTSMLPTTTASTVDAAVAGDVIDNTGIQFNDTGHGFTTGMKVQLTTTDTPPANLSLATNYYVIRVDADNYKFAENITNAVAGTAIGWVDDGVGVHTVTPQHNITTTASTFVVESPTHGLAAGNWIYAYHSATGTNNSLQFAGWWQIASVTTHSFTVNFTNTATVTTADVDSFVTATAKTDIPVWLGTDGNINTAGANDFSEFIVMTRLTAAINCTMRVTDLAVTGQSAFEPWVIASSGSEIGLGRMVLRVGKHSATTLEVKLPASITTAQIFVNDTLRAAAVEVQARVPRYPSRVALSYSNFPELFDNPYGTPGTSDSIIDINSSDGQEITGLIPFFGESAFGASQVESLLVVFKTNSVYLVDIESRQISKLQSRGLGCTAPFSIAGTKDGIMFANESGIHKLNRDQSITYAGKNMERHWEDSVNKDYLETMVGHHYGIGRKYKLSVPYGTDQVKNNQVFVYDHQREGKDQEFGAWTRYTNHAATGWCNLSTDAFFATSDGQVYKIRNTGTSTDYRDDADAVDEMVMLLKAEDFGVPGSRKITSNVVSEFQMRRSSMNGTTISIGSDLDGTFYDVDDLTITKDATVKVKTLLATAPRRRAVYTQVRYTNSTKDEDVVLSGVAYSVALLSPAGVEQVADST